MEGLISYFKAKGITGSELDRVINAFHVRHIQKGDFFVQEGSTSKYLAFVTKGLFRYYYLRDGEEITTFASGANAFLLSLCSFYKQQPSKENIRALADAEIWQVHYKDLVLLKNESNAFNRFYIDALENLVVSMDETRSNLIILTAEERYDFLMKKEPALLQQIPLQYLASILGVTPRHLSRIRNNYTGY